MKNEEIKIRNKKENNNQAIYLHYKKKRYRSQEKSGLISEII